MSFAKLVIIQPGHASRELKVEDGLVTIGRALDNSVALEDDSNVSRYHAEIERRGDKFWLIELGSSNGTTLNDRTVDSDRQLEHGGQPTAGRGHRSSAGRSGHSTLDRSVAAVHFGSNWRRASFDRRRGGSL